MRCMVGPHFLVYFVRQTGGSFSYLFEKNLLSFPGYLVLSLLLATPSFFKTLQCVRM